MVKRISITIGSALALLLAGLLVLFFIVGVTSTSSAGCTLPTGRAISATGHCYLGVETNQDTATIRTLWHTIVVEPTKVTIDGQVAGPISPAANSVDVHIDWRTIKVLADGELVNGRPTATASRAEPNRR